MTLKHKLKLIPARIRWTHKYLMAATGFSEKESFYRELIELKEKIDREYHDKYRKSPGLPEVYQLKGKLDLIKEILLWQKETN